MGTPALGQGSCLRDQFPRTSGSLGEQRYSHREVHPSPIRWTRANTFQTLEGWASFFTQLGRWAQTKRNIHKKPPHEEAPELSPHPAAGSRLYPHRQKRRRCKAVWHGNSGRRRAGPPGAPPLVKPEGHCEDWPRLVPPRSPSSRSGPELSNKTISWGDGK